MNEKKNENLLKETSEKKTNDFFMTNDYDSEREKERCYFFPKKKQFFFGQ